MLAQGSITMFAGVETPSVEEGDVLQQVQFALRNSPYLPLRVIRCVRYAGTILLCGRVPTFYLKQLAQSIAARAVGGVEGVDNKIEVVRPGSGLSLRGSGSSDDPCFTHRQRTQ